LDFGMVRLAESQLTKAGASLGTVNYMSPEQLRGERCTAASDVFSAGIVFYQLASGRHPFSSRDRSLAQVVSAIAFEKPPKLSELSPDAPEGLEFILNKALEKDPAKRLQNAGDLKQALALCRITMKLSGPAAVVPQASEAEATALPQEDEKTRVIKRVAGASGLAGSEDAGARLKPEVAPENDDEKKRALRHTPMNPGLPSPAAPGSPAQPISPKPPAPAIRFRYCPSCTSANPPEVEICQRCGLPLQSASVPALDKPRQWSLYIAITVAALLAIALVIALIGKR